MRTRHLLLPVLAILSLAALSANGESRRLPATRPVNLIIVESQIQDLSVAGDKIIVRLYRQPYDFVAPKWLRVRTSDDRALYAADLQPRDIVRIEGDLDQSDVDPFDYEHRGIVRISRIELHATEEHRP